MPILTYNFRIKDSNKALVKVLSQKAFAVNQVWNFCNETQLFGLKHKKLWPSAYTLMDLTAGSSKELGISSATIQQICKQYVESRVLAKKPSLNWRSSKKSLPWIPFKKGYLKLDLESSQATYCGITFKFWKHREVLGELVTGSIVADSRGRWYINLTCKLPETQSTPRHNPVGVDLGLKDLATLSDGKVFKANRYTRQYENKLAKAQRARKKKQVRSIHAKIKNSRKDSNHKVSREIVNNYSHVYIGNVNSTDLIQSKKKMAKSVLDAGWCQLKSFIHYKALASGVLVQIVNEAWSTQTCSDCHIIPTSSPKGVTGLSIREWVCCNCSSCHHRDVNAAKNILRSGHRPLLATVASGSSKATADERGHHETASELKCKTSTSLLV